MSQVIAVEMLREELEKVEVEHLKRIADIWGLVKIPNDKTTLVNRLIETAKDEYFLKGVLEKLTPLQVQIYSIMVASKNVLTLGEISRKIRILPINVEKELAVLKHLMLTYQRKNRERITSNLDKYYPFEEIRNIISIEDNENGEKIKYSIKRDIETKGTDELDSEYLAYLGNPANKKEGAKRAIEPEVLQSIIDNLEEAELFLLDEAFSNGGVIEINAARIIMDEKKLPQEGTLRRLHGLNIIKDIYYIDERFVRLLVLPVELFEYLTENPVFPIASGIKELQERVISNELDFVLNVKKLLLFISNKGLTLAQSEKIKQADIKKSEDALLEMDMRLFPEKSQVHLIEIILPFVKLFDLVDLRGEDIILLESYEEFLKKDPLESFKEFVKATADASDKRMVGNDVFLPMDVPFFKQEMLQKVVDAISKTGGIYVKVIIARMIREWVVLSPEFRVKFFKNMYVEKRNSIVSALFYMHLFGLLEVEYPKRLIRFSSLGRHYFFNEDLGTVNEPGSVIVNPDASIVAMPDKLSIFGLHLLKSFSELKDYDNIYNFQITKDSMQVGLLIGNNVDSFLEFLNYVSKNRVPQNLLFLISDWSEELPIVTIEEGVVLLETSNAKMMDLLLGQVKGKKIIKKELSPTAIIIYKTRVQEIMEVAEKLEMIIKLVR
ncbi:MAG: helicase-associated domain-containing protein [Leptospirales bacterium]